MSKKIPFHQELTSKFLKNPEVKSEISPKESLKEILRKPTTPVSIKEMARAIERGATHGGTDFRKPRGKESVNG